VLDPTVLTDVDGRHEGLQHRGVRSARRVHTYDDVEEAFAAANDTRYGLHAGIFTTDLADARSGPSRCSTSAGSSSTTCRPGGPTRCPTAVCATPGNTREGPAYAVHEMTEIRSAVIS
jgi:acyl-CoA reductase-like NAD-dependent aldehyde dehydrogenase